MRFEDLPPAIQRQIRAGQGEKRSKVVTLPHSPAHPPMPKHRQSWRCVTCGEVFTAWAKAQRHANELGHVRIELILPGER